MYYVDTSVLISYIFASEAAQETTREILEDQAKRHGLYASPLTLIETCNTICRKVIAERKWKLIDPLQLILPPNPPKHTESQKDPEETCRFLQSLIINFLKENLGMKFIDDEELYTPTPASLNDITIPKIFKKTIDLSHKLRIRVKDLLHLTYALMLKRKYNIKYFLTRDIEDFGRVKETAKQLLHIEIILVKQNK